MRSKQRAAIQPLRRTGTSRCSSSRLASADEDVSTRADFDRYEMMLRLKRIFSVLVLLAFVAGCGYLFWWGVIERNFSRSDTESEPNDSLQAANLLLENDPVQGFIGEPAAGERADVDFFQMENHETGVQIASIEVTGVPDIDLVLKVYTENGAELVAVNSAGEGEAEVIPNLHFSERYLYLMIREYWVRNRPARSNTTDPYTLTLHTREPVHSEELEPNNRSTDALQVRDLEAYRGLVGWKGDMDFYRGPELPPGGTMVSVTLEPGPSQDLQLAFHDIRAGEPLFTIDDAGAGEAENGRFFAATERGHGVLFVVVSSSDPDAFNGEEFYRLRIRYEPVPGLNVPVFTVD